MEQSDVALEHAVDPPNGNGVDQAPANGGETLETPTNGQHVTDDSSAKATYKWDEYLDYKDPADYLDKQSVIYDVSAVGNGLMSEPFDIGSDINCFTTASIYR